VNVRSGGVFSQAPFYSSAEERRHAGRPLLFELGSIARTAISTVTTELGGSNAAHKAK
jgi:hypothetical protein